MPEYGKISKEKLNTCHPLLQELFTEVIMVFDCSILEGHRDKARQDQLFEWGRSRCRWPDSMHNKMPSMAVDVAPYYAEKPHIRWEKKYLFRWYYFAGIVIEIAREKKIPIRWGGDWDMDTYVRNQKFNDLPHFELINE